MSKSLGNVSTVSDLLAAGHKGETLRLALLSAHYRQPLDWNDALLEQSKATLEKFHSSLHFEQLSDHDSVVVDEADEEVLALLSDDLTGPGVIARLPELDRQSVVTEKGGSVRVELGVRRLVIT